MEAALSALDGNCSPKRCSGVFKRRIQKKREAFLYCFKIIKAPQHGAFMGQQHIFIKNISAIYFNYLFNFVLELVSSTTRNPIL